MARVPTGDPRTAIKSRPGPRPRDSDPCGTLDTSPSHVAWVPEASLLSVSSPPVLTMAGAGCKCRHLSRLGAEQGRRHPDPPWGWLGAPRPTSRGPGLALLSPSWKSLCRVPREEPAEGEAQECSGVGEGLLWQHMALCLQKGSGQAGEGGARRPRVALQGAQSWWNRTRTSGDCLAGAPYLWLRQAV